MRLDPDDPDAPPSDPARPEYLDIDTGRAKRWRGVTLFFLAFFGVAGLLVAMFHYLTSSVAMSVTVVLFMLSFMGLMGWITSRNLDERK
jgi:hypothetical protein